MPLIRGSLNRDLRVDFFRGLALWWIFTDHIPGDVMSYVSLQNFALCDAAEVFVLLAGFGAGKAYASRMDKSGWLRGAAGAIQRAWTLYIAHIFLFVIYAAQVSYSAVALDRGNYLDESGLNVLAGAPYNALLKALTLQYQPSLLNILPLYVVLLLIFAMAMPLLRWPKILAILSLILYATVRAADFNLPSWTGDTWFFNPFTWQLLFMIGAILAYKPPAMPPRTVRRVVDCIAIAVVVFGLVVIFGIWDESFLALHLPWSITRALLIIDKTNLDPLRLTSILAFLWLAVRYVPPGATWLRSRLALPFVLMGQHSLSVFCSGIFFGFICRLMLEWDDRAAMQFAVNAGGFVAMLSVAALAAWYASEPSHRPVATVSPEPVAAEPPRPSVGAIVAPLPSSRGQA
jgi:hypothetical protein